MNYEIDWNFRYHAPTPEQVPKYEELRAAFKTLAIEVHEKCPDSRERSIALTQLESAMFWANASVARHPEPQAGSIFFAGGHKPPLDEPTTNEPRRPLT